MLSQILQIVSVNAFEQLPLAEPVMKRYPQKERANMYNQLALSLL
jgi:hypothetical protein